MTFTVDVKYNVMQLGPVVNDSVKQLATDIQNLGRADIQRAGRIGRFAKGFRTRSAKYDFGHVVYVDWRPNYAKIFETGGTSVGRPLLWIPVPGRRGRIGKSRLKLYRPKGKNVLIAARGGQIRFIGVRSVTIKRRVHIKEIVQREVNHFAEHMVARAGKAA